MLKSLKGQYCNKVIVGKVPNQHVLNVSAGVSLKLNSLMSKVPTAYRGKYENLNK